MSRDSSNSVYQVPEIALPTLALVGGVLVLWLGGIVGYLAGIVPWTASFLMNLVAAYVAFTGLHDASHFSLGRKRWISIVVGECLSVVLFANFQIFRQIHQRHHRHTNDENQDPDAWLGAGPTWQLPLRWLMVDVHYLRAFQFSQLKIGRFEFLAMVASAMTTATLIAVLVGSGNSLLILTLWFLPARISLMAAAYYADYVPHQRPHATPRKQHKYAHTANIRGRLLGVLLVGHNMHLVHHLYPGVPFYRCFKIWRLRRDEWLGKGAQEVSLTRPNSKRNYEPSDSTGQTELMTATRVLS